MKKFFIILGIFTATLLLGLYLTFLFVLPNVLDLNKYKPEIQKLVKEQGNLELNIQNIQLVTKPNLQAGISTGNVSVILPDNSTIFNADDINVRISLLQLLALRVNILGEIQDPTVDLEIKDGKQYKIVSHIESLLNNNQSELEKIEDNAETSEAAALPINPDWIKIFAHIKLNNYKIIVNDIKSAHNLKLQGDNLYLGYYNNKKIKVKTNAKFYSDGENMINANVDINSFLPEFEPADIEEDDAIEVKIPFVNPVLVYRDYNLKGNLNAKLKIREKNGVIKSWGFFDLENLTANLSGLQLPESYLKFRTKGTKIITDTNLYFAKNQNLKITGNFDYLAPNMDLSVLSEKIYINDVIILSKAILDTLHIKNDFHSLKGDGYFIANADINTNFKKLKSNGAFIVNNGKIASDKMGLVLDKMNINVNLDDNVLTIPNSGARINGKTLSIKGSIDEKTYTDIDISLQKLPLPELYKVFAPTDIKRQFDLISGNLTLQAKITGKLKEAISNVKLNLADFKMSDTAKTFVLSNEFADVEFFNNFKSGLVRNKNLNIFIPMSKSLISVPMSSVNLDLKSINIPKSILKINDHSFLIFSGDVQNYLSKPSINLVSTGDIYASDLRKFVGKDFESFVDAKGKMPIEISLNGNDKKQTFNMNIFANSNNYITPLHVKTLMGQDTVLKTTVNIHGNHIKIKDTGLFTQTKTVNEEGVEQIKYNPVVEIYGTIIGDYINKISINIPKETESVIYAFKNSALTVKPTFINIYSDTSSPKFRGNLSVANVSVPQLYTTLKTADIKFKDTYLNFNLSDLILNGSDMAVNGDLNLVPSKDLEISNLKISSKFLDADKIMKVSDAAMKILPQAESSEPADIPVVITNGSINFKHIKSGDINLKNTTSKIHLRKNILFINDLLTHMCDGRINGRIAMNLLDGFMKIQVKGFDLNTEKLLLEAAAMRDTLTGKTNFSTDISLSGSTLEEQMKSLAGKVNFTIKDGQFGPFGRLENMILAENIRESEFFKSTIGKALEPLITIDTTHFSTLDGKLTFKDGIVTIEPINSSGNILALNIFGKFNLLTNIAEMKVRSRLASDVSDMLGPISMINPINLVKNTPGLNIVMAKSFSVFCESVTQEELDNIPDFAKKHSDSNATKFQIVLRGNVNKPFTLVKSFKWIATQAEIEKAQDFANELQLPEEEPVQQSQTNKKIKNKNKGNK